MPRKDFEFCLGKYIEFFFNYVIEKWMKNLER